MNQSMIVEYDTDAAQCPNCGSLCVPVTDCAGGFRSGVMFRRECEECGASAPPRRTARQAAEEWRDDD